MLGVSSRKKRQHTPLPVGKRSCQAARATNNVQKLSWQQSKREHIGEAQVKVRSLP